MAVSAELIGKAADFVGAFADSLGKEFGADEKQESAELLAKIGAAVLRKVLGVSAPLVAGATLADAEFGEAVDELIELARAGG